MKKAVVIFILMLITSIQLCAQDSSTLHSFYEQNGDCYVLLGEGSNAAVWALHNLEPGRSAEILYRSGDAYGITATQKWDGESKKTLYTFAAKQGATNQTLQNTKVERKMLVGATAEIFPFGTVPNRIVHRIHSKPWGSPTQLGNHPASNKFNGYCIPCNYNPDTTSDLGAVPGKPGWYYYVVGKYWYHAADIPAWSNWTYNNRSGASGAAENGYRQTVDGTYKYGTSANPVTDTATVYQYGTANANVQPSNGPWAQLCSSRQGTSCAYSMAGWAHRVVREWLYGNYVDMTLYSYLVNQGPNKTPKEEGVVASNVLANITGSMDLQGECTDGCIPAVNGVALPGIQQPILKCTYSPITNRTYLYRRDEDTSNFELQGINSSDVQIGDPTDLTSRFLGISSKSSDGNYVYILGKNLVNSWISESGATAMSVSEVTDTAVSDQWWQQGGIIYIYDKSKEKVLSFTRKEGAASGIPEEIGVNTDGILPDKIGADGFGSLYMLRTEFVPSKPADFKVGDIYSKKFDHVKYGTTTNVYIATFKQNVYKTVFRRLYTTGKTEKISNRILLGSNTFIREFTTDNNAIDGKIQWELSDSHPSAYTQLAPIVDTNTRCELAVINSPTPPRPENINSELDLIGPLVMDLPVTTANPTGFKVVTSTSNCATCSKPIYKTSDDAGKDIMYLFMVENYPDFDVNGLNIGNREDYPRITDGDSIVGKFPTTIKESSINYYWKIIQIYDKDHNYVNKVVMDMEADGATGTSMIVVPSSLDGRLKIGVKMTYKYYDYTKLGVGKLADRKEEALTDWKVAGRTTGTCDSNGYAWNEIEIIHNKVIQPTEAGIIMAGTSYDSDNSFKPGPTKCGSLNLGYGCSENCSVHQWCKDNSDEKKPASTKFVIDGLSLCKYAKSDTTYGYETDTNKYINWGLCLRDTKENYKNGIDRVSMIINKEPPDPQDPKEVNKANPELWTRKWESRTLTWKSELKKGSETLVSEQISKTLTAGETGSAKLSLTDMRKLFPIVSEPYSYHVTVEMNGAYSYQYFETVRMPVMPLKEREEDQTYINRTFNLPRVVNLSISAESDIIVTDNFATICKNSYTTDIPGAYIYKAKDSKLTGDDEKIVKAYYLTKVATMTTYTNENLPSKEIEFVVVDNNPFANIDENKDVYTDQFHYNSSDTNKKLTRLKTNYNKNNPKANFIHETYSNGEKEYSITPKILNKSEVEARGIPYYRYLSYFCYTINSDKLSGFSKNADGTDSKNMDLYNATNKAGYRNLMYGIKWQEACSTNDNTLESSLKTGQITVLDNERPNGYIIAEQDKYSLSSTEQKKYYSPNMYPLTSFEEYKKGWSLITNIDNNNGPKDINASFPQKITITKGYYNKLKPAPTAVYNNIFGTYDEAGNFTIASEPLEINVPVKFTYKLFDNINIDNNNIQFNIYDKNNNKVNALYAKNDVIQHVFREPNEYYIEVSFKDNALSEPSYQDYYNKYEQIRKNYNTGDGSNPKQMERIIRGYFKVYSTKFDLRIIERQNVER